MKQPSDSETLKEEWPKKKEATDHKRGCSCKTCDKKKDLANKMKK